MPQSTIELRDKFWHRDEDGVPTSDGIEECEDILRKYGVTFARGYISTTGIDVGISEELNDAIEFLVYEWDYAFDGYVQDRSPEKETVSISKELAIEIIKVITDKTDNGYEWRNLAGIEYELFKFMFIEEMPYNSYKDLSDDELRKAVHIYAKDNQYRWYGQPIDQIEDVEVNAEDFG